MKSTITYPLVILLLVLLSPMFCSGGELETDELIVNDKGTFYGDLVVTQETTQGSVPTNSVLYYTFNTDESGIVTDQSGNNHTGTVSGATWSSGGRIEGAYSFDGTDDKIDVGNHTDLEITGDLSISMWIKQTSAARKGLLAMDGSSEAQADNILYRLIVTAGGNIEYIHEYNGGVNQQDTDMGFGASAGTWAHLVMVRDTTAKKVTLYKNAVADADTYTYGTNPNGGTSSDLVVGSVAGGGIPFNGLIDEFIIYDRALTTTEITNLYLYNGTNFSVPTAEFREGIRYSKPLGDIEMGIYTNTP